MLGKAYYWFLSSNFDFNFQDLAKAADWCWPRRFGIVAQHCVLFHAGPDSVLL